MFKRKGLRQLIEDEYSRTMDDVEYSPLELHEILDALPKGYRKKVEHDEEELDFDEALRKGIPLT